MNYTKEAWSALRQRIVKDAWIESDAEISTDKRVKETAKMVQPITIKAQTKNIAGFDLVVNQEHIDQFPAEIRETYYASIEKRFGVPYPQVLAEIEAGRTPKTAAQRLKAKFGIDQPAHRVHEIANGDVADFRSAAYRENLKKLWGVS